MTGMWHGPKARGIILLAPLENAEKIPRLAEVDQAYAFHSLQSLVTTASIASGADVINRCMLRELLHCQCYQVSPYEVSMPSWTSYALTKAVILNGKYEHCIISLNCTSS